MISMETFNSRTPTGPSFFSSRTPLATVVTIMLTALFAIATDDASTASSCSTISTYFLIQYSKMNTYHVSSRDYFVLIVLIHLIHLIHYRSPISHCFHPCLLFTQPHSHCSLPCCVIMQLIRSHCSLFHQVRVACRST